MSLARSSSGLRYSLPIRPVSIASTLTQRRTARWFTVKEKGRKTPHRAPANPLLEDHKKREKELEAAARRAEEGRPRASDPSREQLGIAGNEQGPIQGSLAPSSLLHHPIAQYSPGETGATAYGNVVPLERIQAIDPHPEDRRYFEVRQVIRDIRKRGRQPRRIVLKRTERAFTLRSPLIRTSMKKLSPLANQIQGKTIDEAILQMEFSKKRVALAVREHLELARDQAIVTRGMGLGAVNGPHDAASPQPIRLKDGQPHVVRDPTAMYVARAWVNRGAYGRDQNRRARGRIDLLRLPQTSISIQLKEESSRLREHAEREERARKAKPWVQMPDRPLLGQQQYYTW